MISLEIRHRVKQLSLQYQVLIGVLLMLELGFELYTFRSTNGKWLLMFSQPLTFAAWRLPVFLISTVLLLQTFNTFQRIRFTPSVEFKTNMILIAINAGINTLFAVGTTGIIILISESPQPGIWAQSMLIVGWRYLMFFLFTGVLVYLGYLLIKRKFIICALVLCLFIGGAVISIGRFQEYLFMFIYAQYDGYGFALLPVSFCFIGSMLILSSCCYLVNQRRELLGGTR